MITTEGKDTREIKKGIGLTIIAFSIKAKLFLSKKLSFNYSSKQNDQSIAVYERENCVMNEAERKTRVA